MTGKIFNFEAAKRAKSPPPLKSPKTDHELFVDVYEEIIDEWRKFAAKNALNEFIKKKLPSFVRGPENSDFVNDLNVLALAEEKLDIKVMTFSPGTSLSNPHGWMVIFHLNKEVYSASPLMATETYARALNILLFVEFTSRLKKLKRL